MSLIAYPNALKYREQATDPWSTATIFAKADLESLADKFDTTETYTEGEIVLYQGGMYKCKAGGAGPGAWDATEWDQTTVEAELAALQTEVDSVKNTLTQLDSNKADKSAAVSNITRSGTTFTATRANGTTFTFDQQDNNTTTGTSYNAGSCPDNTTFGTNGSIARVYTNLNNKYSNFHYQEINTVAITSKDAIKTACAAATYSAGLNVIVFKNNGTVNGVLFIAAVNNNYGQGIFMGQYVDYTYQINNSNRSFGVYALTAQ